MSRLRRHARAEMGEAINFEDVLTVIAVLLLLRLIFMVPLVNLDKAKTIAARRDSYWSEQAHWILGHPGDSAQGVPYRTAFALEGKTVLYTQAGQRAVYLEAADADSNVTILRHNPATGKFIAMNVQGRGHSRSFRRGMLIWSADEKEWFPASDSVDYGTREESKAMEKEFREWTKERRGY
jgi:hypothetical protein